MKHDLKISGFGNWIIPSGEGVLYLEGAPTEDQKASDRKRTAESRKIWEPSIDALDVQIKLKCLQGRPVKIQLWDDMMAMLPEEGPLPFSCELVRVFTKSVKEEDRDFQQLFVEFKNPKPIENGNTGGNPINETYFRARTGTYIYNCSMFSWVEERIGSKINEVCSFITANQNEIINNLDYESVAVYQFLKDEFQKGDVTTNYVFQFLFRSFYRLDNAGLTSEFKTEYFKILEELRHEKEINIWIVDKRLAEIKDLQGRRPIQISFISKLINTIDPTSPIYDSEVARMFGFKVRYNSKTRHERLAEYEFQLSTLFNSYQIILENSLLKSTFHLFEKKFIGISIPKTKMLDFIMWQAGKLKAKK